MGNQESKTIAVKQGDAYLAPPGYTVIHSPPAQRAILEQRYAAGEEACSSCGLTLGESNLLHDLKHRDVSLVSHAKEHESIAIAALREIKTIYGSMAAQLATEALNSIESKSVEAPADPGTIAAGAAQPQFGPAFFDTPLMRVHLEHLRHCKASDLQSGTEAFYGFLGGEIERAFRVLMSSLPKVAVGTRAAAAHVPGWREQFQQDYPGRDPHEVPDSVKLVRAEAEIAALRAALYEAPK